MTAVCPGGVASRQKPGYGVTIAVGAGGIAGLLNNIPLWPSIVAGAALGGITYDLSTMCPQDPPSFPTFSGPELVMASQPLSFPAESAAAIAKLYQLVKIYAWYQFCECVSGTTPAAPAAPAPPSGSPQVSPPLGGGTPSAPCWDQQASHLGTAGANQYTNVTANLGPAAATHTVSNAPAPPIAYSLPTPLPSWMRIFIAVDAGFGAQDLNLYWNMYTAAGAQVANDFISASSIVGTFWDVPIPPNAAWYTLSVIRITTPFTATGTCRLQFWCGGSTPNGLSAPCCPPDPTLAGQIQQILGLVTLLQRQNAPFAYVFGNAHAGLSGNGVLAVAGLLGMRLQMTSIPTFVGQESGDPNEFFEAGWFSWGNADGFSPRTRITHSPQLSLPADCGVYGSLGYSLTPGVVATITELVREP